MKSRTLIDSFLSHKTLALIRASRKTPVRGVSIGTELEAKGYTIHVVYLDEDPLGPTLMNLKVPVEGVIISVPRDLTEKAVRQVIEAKIPRVWIQRDSYSQPAVRLCREKGIEVVHGECVMMFAEPVRSFHAFHRWLWKALGKMPV